MQRSSVGLARAAPESTPNMYVYIYNACVCTYIYIYIYMFNNTYN